MLPLRKSKIIAHSKLQLPEGRWILLGCCFATGYIQVYKTKWSLQHPSTVMFVGLVAFLGGLWLSPHALQITISVTVCWKTTRRRRLPRRALQGLECQSDCWEIPSSFRGNNVYCGHQSIFIGITISLSLYTYIYTHSFFWDIWPFFWHLFWHCMFGPRSAPLDVELTIWLTATETHSHDELQKEHSRSKGGK